MWLSDARECDRPGPDFLLAFHGTDLTHFRRPDGAGSSSGTFLKELTKQVRNPTYSTQFVWGEPRTAPQQVAESATRTEVQLVCDAFHGSSKVVEEFRSEEQSTPSPQVGWRRETRCVHAISKSLSIHA
jgi:hypothetical protein